MPPTSSRALIAIAMLAMSSACGGAAVTTAPARVAPSGPRSYVLAIELRSELGGFEVDSYAIHLDGSIVAEAHAAPSEDAATPSAPLALPVCAHRSLVQAGSHDLAVVLVLRGVGYGVFSYLRAYRFTVRSETAIDVRRSEPGLQVIATAYEGGSVTTPIEERPHVRVDGEPLSDAFGGCRPR